MQEIYQGMEACNFPNQEDNILLSEAVEEYRKQRYCVKHLMPKLGAYNIVMQLIKRISKNIIYQAHKYNHIHAFCAC